MLTERSFGFVKNNRIKSTPTPHACGKTGSKQSDCEQNDKSSKKSPNMDTDSAELKIIIYFIDVTK